MHVNFMKSRKFGFKSNKLDYKIFCTNLSNVLIRKIKIFSAQEKKIVNCRLLARLSSVYGQICESRDEDEVSQ